MRFGSVCSGIEAASVAWDHLGWRADWFAEIEAFPSSVLAHHWPDVQNVGNMLTLPDMIANDNLPAPDVLVGGTPCQAFSVAGRRGSLEDERGALSLAYVELANEIDRRRAAAGSEPCIIVWENVPGVLSTKDNAFGCFLAGLAGESQPLFPAGGRWSNAGCVFGPERTVAWRILDAQYFGVAQRRRRVFVVASARDGFDPCQVLFEFDGVRRDTAPSREKGQGFAADAGSGAAGGCFWDGGQLTQTLDAVLHKGQTMPEKNRFPAVLQPTNDNAQAIPILEAGARTGVSTTDPRAGIGIGHDGDPVFTLQAGKQHGVMAFSSKDYGADAMSEMSPTLRAGGHADSHANAGVPPAVAQASMAVRRLTPRECERLQGFPDDHTLVPHRNKPAFDGPRYKALGNSMAVPVMRWIGERIDAHLRSIRENDN